MLKLIRRHRVSCPHTSENYRRCQCPIHVKGTLNGVKIRMGLDLTDWGAASKAIGRWIEAGQIGQVVVTPEGSGKTIADAVTSFLADLKDRNAGTAVQSTLTNLLEKRLLTWAHAQRLTLLSDLTLDRLTRFRQSWPYAPRTKQLSQARLRRFFSWCVRRKYLQDNPAEHLERIRVDHTPTMPFTAADMTAILASADKFARRGRLGPVFSYARLPAFILILRWTGLRIGDAAMLEWSAIIGRRVFLYTQKTGTPVYVPVPPNVVDVVQSLPRRPTDSHLFTTGTSTRKSTATVWDRMLRLVFTDANIANGHAHRFRDTFAVELLLSGVDLADVSILLGHKSIKVTQTHYSPWIAARQQRLESAVESSWGSAQSNHPPPAEPSSSAGGARASAASVGKPDPSPTPESASPDRVGPRPARNGNAGG